MTCGQVPWSGYSAYPSYRLLDRGGADLCDTAGAILSGMATDELHNLIQTVGDAGRLQNDLPVILDQGKAVPDSIDQAVF